MAHMSVPCHEGPPATKSHFSSEPAVAGRGRYYCTGIIINIDTISNINLKAGMCHMEVDWFITYRI